MVNWKKDNDEFVPKISFIAGESVLPEGLAMLESYGYTRIVKKGEVITEAGEPCNFCGIVKSGRIVAYEYTPGGAERVYSYNEKNALILADFILLDCKPPVSFKAAARSELLCVDKQALYRAIRENPEISIAIMKRLAHKFVTSMEQIRYTNSHSATWKVCNLLLMMAENYGVVYDGKIMIKEKLSQQLISSMLGINRITVVRVMKDLKDLELLEHINGYYCIRSVENMRAYQETMK